MNYEEGSPGQNGLYNSDGNAFTDNLFEHWDKMSSEQFKPPNGNNDIQSLEDRMKSFDWYYEYSDDFTVWNKGEEKLNQLKQDLYSLRNVDGGFEKANALWDKYTPENSISKPNFLQGKNIHFMTEQELRFVENQFKKIGVADAFTPELVKSLREAIKDGKQFVQHPFNKMYEGDEANTIFNLKKSGSTNLFFLNSFDLKVRKEGQAAEINRTFYINNFQRNGNDENHNPNKYYTTFTFKAAFNYLSGRPVLNTFRNQNDQEYKSWDILNTKKILPNGKHEEKHYHENYGFDLKSVLNNYSIKERTNPEHFDRLLKSLERGNLQKATFVDKDGKTEQLYVSPNIPLGILNVYDKDKTRIPTDKLVENGYIGKELAQKIQERIANISETQSQKHKQVEKEGNTLKQENGKQKQTVKQKDHLNLTSNKKHTKKQRQKIQ